MSLPYRVSFRALTRNDFSQLGRWLEQAHVARWWADDSSPAALERDYGGVMEGTEPAKVYIALCDEREMGLVQCFRLSAYPEYVSELAPLVALPPEASSMDYFIGEKDLIGHGLGAVMLREFTRKIWLDDMKTSALIVPVHVDNIASCRALERVGFVRIAVGDLEPDNPTDSPHHAIYRCDRHGER